MTTIAPLGDQLATTLAVDSEGRDTEFDLPCRDCVGRFDRLAATRGNRVQLIALLIVGYLLVSLGFGLAAYLLDATLHAMVPRSGWLAFNARVLGAAVLAIAGLFQFSRVKYHCLDKCRTPLSFIMQHWHGVTPRRDTFLLGTHHGAFCVACCWAIMLLMFVVGSGNLGWMLALGAVMAIEKNAAWGRKLSQALGLGSDRLGGRHRECSPGPILNPPSWRYPTHKCRADVLPNGKDPIAFARPSYRTTPNGTFVTCELVA